MDDIEYGWLHISDLHIFKNIEWEILAESFKAIKKVRRIDFILITGDLHQYMDNYEETLLFFNKLSEELNIDKKYFYIVPGNHDVINYHNKEDDCKYIHDHIPLDPEYYKHYFTESKLIKVFEKYNEFVKQFYGDEYSNIYCKSPEQVFVRKYREKLYIIHLNSALISDGKHEKQIVDINEISNISKLLEKNIPRIVIAHHPYFKIYPCHQNYLLRYFTNWNISAYLNGDTHKEKLDYIKRLDDVTVPCITCRKTSIDNKDKYSHIGCYIYQKEKKENKIKVHLYEWNGDKKRFDRDNKFDFDDNIEVSFNLNTSKTEDIDGNKFNYIFNSNFEDEESIWLPDAEKAVGNQTRFETYTATNKIKAITNPNSRYYGIKAVKGIGKTFALQIKRTVVVGDKKNLCLPISKEKPSQFNNWGTDTVLVDTTKNLNSFTDINNLIVLWKYTIIVYVLNQLINIEENIDKNKKWWVGTADNSCIIKKLKKNLKEGMILYKTYTLCTNPEYNNLERIFSNILTVDDFIITCKNDLHELNNFKKIISNFLESIYKSRVCIFIDKVDQSIKELNVEPPSDCDNCYKKDKIVNCNNLLKSDEYCKKYPKCSDSCCFGCENFMSIYSNGNLRIYPNNIDIQYVNIWQYLQISLLKAVDDLMARFGECISIYYTIRNESFKLSKNYFNEQNKKIMYSVSELWYTKEEQYQIYCESIKNQNPKLLFDSSLINKNFDEAFVGVDKLCNPYNVLLDETVFESIYRHSFDTTRDIQEYAEMLTQKMNVIKNLGSSLERGNEVKRLIEEMASKLAYNKEMLLETDKYCYYAEKHSLLPNYWSNPENFERLLSYIDRNLFFSSDLKKICKKYNGINKCSKSGNCKYCNAKYHPFSMLYQLGMLGILIYNDSKDNIKQKFVHSKDITYILDDNQLTLNNNTVYLLHPALTKSIDSLNPNKILHFTGFIIGKENTVKKDVLETLFRSKKDMRVNEFRKKYFR